MENDKLKPEFPPLLAPGLHLMSYREVRRRFVQDFSTSITRARIVNGLEKVIARLNEASIAGELWIDGSFVTEKIDPSDVDFLLCVSSDLYDRDPTAREVIDWASSKEIFDSHYCDAYKLVEYSRSHPLFREADALRGYWQGVFGKSLRGVPKGIALLTLPAVIE